ncbi:hypothetical protein M426DRAFT_264916 [Hypoxylon sp. CI-4A]|nr:hypothetical protein M426DRAFT_264916 [Hypoxylon sp. CI-4A]
MPIRVLCLHGQGVNADIFQKQTEAVRQMLPSDYQFCFFNGKYECEPAPEVLDVFPPPYLTWYNTPTTRKIFDAHSQVRDIVARHGPFDAVMGFSQAPVAASLLLHQELDGEVPKLFKAAIFIGSPVPFSYRKDVGIDARTYFGVSNDPPNEHNRPVVIPSYLVTDPAYLRNAVELNDKDACAGVQYYQMFHPTVDAVRINLPTGHIYGSGDQWFPHSKDLAELCREDLRAVFQHDGGHEVPRGYSEELCDVIETVFSKIEKE